MKRREIERLLPNVFRRTIHPDNPLLAILEVMSALHEPSESVLDSLDAAFNPFRAREDFVPFLACWLDLERLFDEPQGLTQTRHTSRPPISTGIERLRALTAAAAYLSQWRGTRKGLGLFLEIATGIEGFVIEEQVLGPDGQPMPFHLRVIAPEAVKPHQSLISRIIESEKPAYVTYELTFEATATGGDPK
jgi:phage tail-like protein